MMEYTWLMLIWIPAFACSPIDSKKDHSFLERLRTIRLDSNALSKLNERLQEIYSTPTEYTSEVKEYYKSLVSEDRLLKKADEKEHSLAIQREDKIMRENIGNNYKEYLEGLCAKEIPKLLLLKKPEFSAELGEVESVSSIATTSCKLTITSVSQSVQFWIQSFNMKNEKGLGKYFNLIGRLHNGKEFIAMEIIEYSDRMTERKWPLPKTTPNSYLKVLANHDGSKPINFDSAKDHMKKVKAYYDKLVKENKLLLNGKEADYDKWMIQKGYKRHEDAKQEQEARLLCDRIESTFKEPVISDFEKAWIPFPRTFFCRIKFARHDFSQDLYMQTVSDQRHLYFVGDTFPTITTDVLEPYDLVQLYDGVEVVAGVMPPKSAAGADEKAKKMPVSTILISKPGKIIKEVQSKSLKNHIRKLEAGEIPQPSAKSGNSTRTKRTPPTSEKSKILASEKAKTNDTKKETTKKEAASTTKKEAASTTKKETASTTKKEAATTTKSTAKDQNVSKVAKSLMEHTANTSKGGKTKGAGATKSTKKK